MQLGVAKFEQKFVRLGKLWEAYRIEETGNLDAKIAGNFLKKVILGLIDIQFVLLLLLFNLLVFHPP